VLRRHQTLFGLQVEESHRVPVKLPPLQSMKLVNAKEIRRQLEIRRITALPLLFFLKIFISWQALGLYWCWFFGENAFWVS
jgi:hypothetical protein